MKPNSTTTPTAVDRLATLEEVLAAGLPDPVEECTRKPFSEIPSEMGGYARVSASLFEIASMVEGLLREESANSGEAEGVEEAGGFDPVAFGRSQNE
ncbi:MAG: hypothetical protein LAO19_00250 [Acidobacteriia bacterium]|nr:hypothetical protein [Terriglobia bacterium]